MLLWFLSHLLGAWLLLSQIPSETIADTLKTPPTFVCKNTIVNGIKNYCRVKKGENFKDGMALQQRTLSGESPHSSPLVLH
jgi:hypothetical protein